MESRYFSRLNFSSFRLSDLAVYLNRNWLKILFLSTLGYLLFQKDVSVELNLQSAGAGITDDAYATERAPAKLPVRTVSDHQHTARKAASGESKKWEDRKANKYANLTFVLSPTYAERHNIAPAIVRQKLQTLRGYVKNYANIAVREMQAYGIPASITLAQALLESDAGESRLAVESNNHFGIKCRSKCRGCTCRDYTDDDIYDMFRVFDSPWESFREHSLLLTGARYRHLLNLDKTDYRAWARGLRKAGYATDKRYAEKLIKIIEEMKLYRFDTLSL